MCFNCSLSVKSMKFGMMIVFKALKKIGYGATAKSPLSAKNKTFYYGGHFEPEVKLTFSLKRLNFSNLDKKMSANT